MKKFISIIIAAAALFIGSAASAQNKCDHASWKDKMKAEKIAYLTSAMNLTSAEAEKFWPIYNSAEADKHASFKAIISAYKEMEDAINAGKSEKEISNLVDKYLSAQEQGKDIDSKYLKEYKKILSAEKIAKLYIGEESFRKQQIQKLRRGECKKN